MNVLRFILPKSSVEYIYKTSTVRQALEKMQYHHYVAIPVLDDEGRYVGTLRNDDLFKYFLEGGAFDARAAERDSVMSILDTEYSAPITHNATMNQLIENVREHNFVPVVDDRGCFIGIILRRDILNFLLKYYESQGGNKQI